MAGTITGTVADIRSSRPLDGATVQADPGGHTTKTGNDGSYSLSLDDGTYDLQVSSEGYDPFDGGGIVVLDGLATEINVGLWPSDW